MTASTIRGFAFMHILLLVLLLFGLCSPYVVAATGATDAYTYVRAFEFETRSESVVAENARPDHAHLATVAFAADDVASDDAVAARGASSAFNAVKLEKQLASAAQMGEAGTTMAGAGGRAVFRDAQRIAQQYGGNAADWVKKTSSSFLSRDGTRFETHWVENIVTGERVEFKTIIR